MLKTRLSFIFLGILLIAWVSAAGFQDSSQGDFNLGTYDNTHYDLPGSFVSLNISDNLLMGSFLSRVFDAGGVANWDNFTLGLGTCYGCELPNNQGSESSYLRDNVSMSSNVLLIHLNENSNTIMDYSGQANHGAGFGGVSYGNPGRFNTSFDFDGNNDRGDFGDKIDFNSLNEITIEAWVNPNRYDNFAGNNFPSIVDKRFDMQYSMYFNVYGNVVVDLETSNGHFDLIGNNSQETSQWHHTAFTYDGNELRLYIDGILENATAASGIPSSNSRNLLIGAGWAGNLRSYYFDGRIDEVALYQRALSANEIYARYQRGVASIDLNVRSCDDPNCSGESFVDFGEEAFQDISVIDNRYFQYLFNFTNENNFTSPELYFFEVEYEVQNSAPSVSLLYPENSSYGQVVSELNYSVSDSDGNLDSCWYSLDGGVTNISINCGENVSGISSNEGANYWNIWVNDSIGEKSFDDVVFFVDSLAPEVVITNPGNLTYGGFPIDFNVSLNEVGNVEFSLDGGVTNISMESIDGINFGYSQGSLPDGSYLLEVYALDSFSNLNNTEMITFSISTDSEPPLFSNFASNVPSGSSYSYGQKYEFNVSVSDNEGVNEVRVEFDGVNYSVSEVGGVYRIEFDGLSAGNYNYYWWASDVNGNFNSSSLISYNVSKALTSGIVFGSSPIFYGTSGDVEGTEANEGDGDVLYSLFREETLVSNPDVVVLSAGNYSYEYNASSGENYSANLLSEFLLNVERGVSEVNLTLNGAEGNITINESTSVLLTGELINGDPESLLGLYLDEDIINQTSLEVSGFVVFNSIGIHNVSVIYEESENYSASRESYFVEVIEQNNRAPNVFLEAPFNNTNLTTRNVELNFSVFDSDGNNLSVFVYGDNSSLESFFEVENGTFMSYNWENISDGLHVWKVIAFDGQYNSSEEGLQFFVNNSISYPEINLIYPSYSSTYGDNSSVPLNFTLNFYEGVRCKYSLDFGLTNTSLPNCQNTQFSVGSDGVYNLTLYAIEGYAGLESLYSVLFFVRDAKPNIHLISPQTDYYSNSSEMTLDYIPSSDFIINRCELWSDFEGIFGLDESDLSINSGELNNFNLTNLTEGSYTWAVGCLDDDGDYALSGNRSLHIDYTPPNVSIFEPNGSYDGETVPLTFEVNDSSPVDSCAYNLTYLTNGQNLNVYIVTACQNTQITVQGDGDYNLDLSAFDAASNEGRGDTSFSVASSGGSGGGGGGGGGGGSGVTSPGEPALTYAGFPELTLKKGRSTIVSFSVLNSGTLFLNNCKMIPRGAFSDLIASSQVEDLALGQKVDFVFELAIPQLFDAGTYDIGIDVVCEETSVNVPLKVIVLPSNFDFKILNTERDGTKFLTEYILEELTGIDQNIEMSYYLSTLDGKNVVEGNESIFLAAGSSETKILEFELPQNAFGEHRLHIHMESDSDSYDVVQRVVLSSRGLTGLAISDANARTLRMVGIILFALVLLFFAVKFLYKHNKRIGRSHHHKGRGFIKIDLKS